MLRPVAPSGLGHPMSTSSTSPGSRCARSIAWRSAWPPMVAPCVMLNAPFQLLHSGVRAVETMTASGMPSTLAAFVRFGIHSAHEREMTALADLVVLDLSFALAGPFASTMLGDYGAEI